MGPAKSRATPGPGHHIRDDHGFPHALLASAQSQLLNSNCQLRQPRKSWVLMSGPPGHATYRPRVGVPLWLRRLQVLLLFGPGRHLLACRVCCCPGLVLC